MLDTIKQIVSPIESNLTSKSREARSAALEACLQRYTEEHAERSRELRKKLAEAEAQHARRVAGAQQTERETRKALRDAIVREFDEQATPLVRAFIEEASRKVAAQLLALLKTFSDREESEIGFRNGGYGPLAWDLLCYAFVAEYMRDAPRIALVFGSDDHLSGDYDRAVSLVRKAGSPAELQNALTALELAIEGVATACAHRPMEQRMLERFARVRLCDPEATAAFDRAPTAAPEA